MPSKNTVRFETLWKAFHGGKDRCNFSVSEIKNCRNLILVSIASSIFGLIPTVQERDHIHKESIK